MATTRTRTVRSSGGDYSSLTAWEAGEQADLVTADEVREAECYSFADTGGVVTIAGWTTDSTRYIRIFTPSSERHDGTAGTGYRLATGAYENGISVQEEYTRIEGISFYNAGLANRYIQVSLASTLDVHIDACLFDGSLNYKAIVVSTMSGGAVAIRNCLFPLGGVGTEAIEIASSGGTAYLYNNTVTTSASNGYYGAGIKRTGSSTVIARNCISIATGSITSWSSFSGTFGSGTSNNVSSDSTAPGSSSKTSSVPTFVGSGDWSLSSSDTVARDSGADLSGVSDYPFSDDILGNSRSGTWDIGAFEYQSAAASALPPKSAAVLTAVRRAAFH